MGDRSQVTFEVLVPREAAERWADSFDKASGTVVVLFILTIFAVVIVRIIDKESDH